MGSPLDSLLAGLHEQAEALKAVEKQYREIDEGADWNAKLAAIKALPGTDEQRAMIEAATLLQQEQGLTNRTLNALGHAWCTRNVRGDDRAPSRSRRRIDE